MIAKKLDEKEFKSKVEELALQGLTSEKIGLVLKREHNIGKSKKAYGTRISQVLKEKSLYVNPDIKNLKAKVEKLKKHLLKNRKDQGSKRCLLIKEAKLRKLERLSKNK